MRGEHCRVEGRADDKRGVTASSGKAAGEGSGTDVGGLEIYSLSAGAFSSTFEGREGGR